MYFNVNFYIWLIVFIFYDLFDNKVLDIYVF